MKLVALCAAAGAGKDTVADMLPARKLAFADTLYREVSEAFGVTVSLLQKRDLKEVQQYRFALDMCMDDEFSEYTGNLFIGSPRSPRQILQWWGDYRRAQDPDYFVKATQFSVSHAVLFKRDVVITDVRFPNEAAMVRQLGGQIWQIKRPGYEAGGTGHASDTAGDEFAPDRVVVNSGDLVALEKQVLALWAES